jgi:hypothetical protein
MPRPPLTRPGPWPAPTGQHQGPSISGRRGLEVLGTQVGLIQERTQTDLSFIPVGQYYLTTAYRRTLSGVIGRPIPFFWNSERRQT